VLWSIQPEGLRATAATEQADEVLRRAHPGAIVDLHDAEGLEGAPERPPPPPPPPDRRPPLGRLRPRDSQRPPRRSLTPARSKRTQARRTRPTRESQAKDAPSSAWRARAAVI